MSWQKELGILSKVEFLGKQSRVVKILCASDLFLLPSEKESFGLAALEAMACEVPVVASNTGGLPEVITHGHSGWLANVGDIESMIDGAIYILENKERHSLFRQNARKTAAEEFNADRVVEAYESLYKELLEN